MPAMASTSAAVVMVEQLLARLSNCELRLVSSLLPSKSKRPNSQMLFVTAYGQDSTVGPCWKLLVIEFVPCQK